VSLIRQVIGFLFGAAMISLFFKKSLSQNPGDILMGTITRKIGDRKHELRKSEGIHGNIYEWIEI